MEHSVIKEITLMPSEVNEALMEYVRNHNLDGDGRLCGMETEYVQSHSDYHLLKLSNKWQKKVKFILDATRVTGLKFKWTEIIKDIDDPVKIPDEKNVREPNKV